MSTPALAPNLVEAACAGDSRALDTLAARCAPLVLGWCRRLCGPRVNAEDAAQDVLERVLKRIHTLQDPDLLEPWLFGITRRRIADLRRLCWAHRWVPGLVIDGPSAGDDAERLAGLSELSRRVQRTLDALPIRERELLVLVHVEGRTSAETAAFLGVPVGTVKSRLLSARTRFARIARRHGLVPGLVEVPR
ncbi:MAG: RNA polymerase sigma factor [Deltaproteobacteria bacterium]|nr:RNA polymerase sigma factor [Deltaproteobacteria bacterium]